MIWLKLHKGLRKEVANLICWLRILTGVGLAITTWRSSVLAIMYSLAFISDVWDGWFYRQLKPNERPNHWFNRLPISMDPIADFIFVGGGIIHVVEDKRKALLLVFILMVIMIAWNIIGRIGSDYSYMVLMTVLTYLWFATMVLMMVLVWHHNVTALACIMGASATLMIFYACYLRLHVKARIIRRRG